MSRRECRSTPCKGPRPIPRLRASLVRGTYQSVAGITHIFYPIGRLVNFIYSMLWNRLAQLFVASWRKRQRRRRWASIPGAHRPQKMRHREHSEAIHFAKALPKLDCRTRSRGFAMTTVGSFEVSKISVLRLARHQVTELIRRRTSIGLALMGTEWAIVLRHHRLAQLPRAAARRWREPS